MFLFYLLFCYFSITKHNLNFTIPNISIKKSRNLSAPGPHFSALLLCFQEIFLIFRRGHPIVFFEHVVKIRVMGVSHLFRRLVGVVLAGLQNGSRQLHPLIDEKLSHRHAFFLFKEALRIELAVFQLL